RISFYEGTEDALIDILTNISDGVTGLTSAQYMFRDTANFGVSPLTKPSFFDIASSGITNMDGTWYNSQFNQDISNLDTSSVTSMQYTFESAQFNQDISNWDVSSVTTMDSMFYNSQFDQDIGDWNVSGVTDMTSMFEDGSLSNATYDNILLGWASLPNLTSAVTFHGGNAQYCAGTNARNDTLIGTYSWSITDGGHRSPCYGTVGNSSDVNATGVNSLNVTIDGSTSLLDYFTGLHSIGFYDGSSQLLNLSFNFSISNFDFSKVNIHKTGNSIIVNLSETLSAGQKKTLFFDSVSGRICVKDALIASVSEFSDTCNGANETKFTDDNCPGTVNNVVCSKSGITYIFANLSHSGVEGVTAIPEFSTYALLLALALTIGGFIVLKRRK
ncbi:BspA family leucine-rich repeat surface protein, partial [Nanoarchaeota archaeon]